LRQSVQGYRVDKVKMENNTDAAVQQLVEMLKEMEGKQGELTGNQFDALRKASE
jgi:hypothetical protein